MVLPTEGKPCTLCFFGEMQRETTCNRMPARVFDTWMAGSPEGTSYNITQSGWMEGYVFEAWFKDVFLKFVADVPKPIVVFFDGHGSHSMTQLLRQRKPTFT